MQQIEVTLKSGKQLSVHQVTNDIYGNPRYVIHYLDIADTYGEALKIIRQIGGKMYTAKWYGGGLVFSTYNLEHKLEELMTYAKKL